MDSQSNPFVSYNEHVGSSNKSLAIPEFPRTVRVQCIISEEAFEQLNNILSNLNFKGKKQTNFSALLECIGIGALHLTDETDYYDPDENISYADCRETGFQDALEGNPQRFLVLFGNAKNVFHRAYVRGYLEGNYIKNRQIRGNK